MTPAANTPKRRPPNGDLRFRVRGPATGVPPGAYLVRQAQPTGVKSRLPRKSGRARSAANGSTAVFSTLL